MTTGKGGFRYRCKSDRGLVSEPGSYELTGGLRCRGEADGKVQVVNLPTLLRRGSGLKVGSPTTVNLQWIY
jgi:hypothetical protein